MKKFKELFTGIITLIVLIGIICLIFYFVFLGIKTSANWFSSLVQQISTLDTVLVVALIVALIIILGIVLNSFFAIRLKAMEYKNNRKAEIRKNLEESYAIFVDMVINLSSNIGATKKMSDKKVYQCMFDFSKDITLFGSSKVIKKWAMYCKNIGELSDKEHLEQLEAILLAIRADLGVSNRGLKSGDVLALFIKGVDEILQDEE